MNYTAVDGLGRKLTEVGERRPGRFVGMFYWTWHTYNGRGKTPRNNTEIIAKYPEAVNDWNHPAWENVPYGYPHFWGEPCYGYYSDLDAYVVRKNAELLTLAGVDVIIFDCTNGRFLWDEEYKFQAKVYLNAIKQGLNVPKFAFMMTFCNHPDTRDMLHRVYKEFYSLEENKDLFFYWEGKPLVMAHKGSLDMNDPLDREIADFFTFRSNEPTYFADDTYYNDTENWWGWCSVYPQTKYSVKPDGRPEQMCVSVAQNANDTGLIAMNNNGGKGVYGRPYAKGDYSYKYDNYGVETIVCKDIPNDYLYGRNFQQQWDYAIENDPEFIFVTGWNELIAGRFTEWEGTPNAFPDQFDYVRSRDIEPTKTKLGDCYYYQLCENVRRYKYEKKPIDVKIETADINIDGFDWDIIKNEFVQPVGSGLARGCDGWGKSLHFEQEAAENSVILSKCAKNEKNLYFMCKCEKNVTFPDVAIFIAASDATRENSWDGFTYAINRTFSGDGTISVERSLGGFNWEVIAHGRMTVRDNIIQYEIPIISDNIAENIGFKFACGNFDDGNMMDFYTKGQTAPAGRFYYKVI